MLLFLIYVLANGWDIAERGHFLTLSINKV